MRCRPSQRPNLVHKIRHHRVAFTRRHCRKQQNTALLLAASFSVTLIIPHLDCGLDPMVKTDLTPIWVYVFSWREAGESRVLGERSSYNVEARGNGRTSRLRESTGLAAMLAAPPPFLRAL